MSKILIAALVFALGILFAGIVIHWQWLLIIPLASLLYIAYRKLSGTPEAIYRSRDVSMSGYKGGKAYRESRFHGFDEDDDEE
jgi:hypothetical protein